MIIKNTHRKATDSPSSTVNSPESRKCHQTPLHCWNTPRFSLPPLKFGFNFPNICKDSLERPEFCWIWGIPASFPCWNSRKSPRGGGTTRGAALTDGSIALSYGKQEGKMSQSRFWSVFRLSWPLSIGLFPLTSINTSIYFMGMGKKRAYRVLPSVCLKKKGKIKVWFTSDPFFSLSEVKSFRSSEDLSVGIFVLYPIDLLVHSNKVLGQRSTKRAIKPLVKTQRCHQAGEEIGKKGTDSGTTPI